jgi:uncharacterized OsmC-like protein
MDRETLRERQRPVKERYAAEPSAALVTLRAEGRIGENVSCSVDTGRALVEAGLHAATGGTGLQVCSGDLLLQALVACAGVTLNSVATALGFPLRDAVIRAEGDLDFRGTLGVSREVPVGFQEIRLSYELEGDLSEDEVATLLRLTERYCVVQQTLLRSPRIEVTARREIDLG